MAYGYFLKLILQDSSGTLPVLVCGKEAEELFSGLPPSNLHANATTLKFVRQRLQRLLTPSTFIDGMIESYQVGLGHGGVSSIDDGLIQDVSVSQMGSQDLLEFFHPNYEQDENDGDEPMRARSKKMIRVFRLKDVAFRAVSNSLL